MPNHTVSTNVDTMLRAADNAAIRTAIGVGTTDSPTLGGITIGTGNAKLQYTPGGNLTVSRVSDGGQIFVVNADANNLAMGSINTDLIRNRFTGANGATLEFLGSGVLEQRNGTTAQSFRVYNTYTDASNYERLNIQWSGNAARIFPSAAGSGTLRTVYFGSDAIASNAFLVDSASNLVQMNTNGSNRWQVNSSGHFLAVTDNTYDIGTNAGSRPRTIYSTNLAPNGFLSFQNDLGMIYFGGAGDIVVQRDLAGTLSQKNGVNAQSFRVYNKADAAVGNPTNYDRGVFDFKTTTNTLRIGTENGGTYTTARPIDFVTGGVVRMSILASGGLDVIGDLRGGATVRCGVASGIGVESRLFMKASADGVGVLTDWSQNNFGRLCLGGITSAFPAIKRNGTGIDIKLADDSTYAPLTAGSLSLGVANPVADLDIADTWNAPAITVTGASGNGTTAVITFATQATAIQVGATIVVASINPAGYNGTFVVTASTVTSVSYLNATTATYVSGGTIERVFTSVKLNVTDTASNAASKLMDLQVGGVSKFAFTKNGFATFTGPGYAIGAIGTHLIFGATTNIYAALDSNFGTDSGGFKVSSAGFFGWSGAAGAQNNATLKLYKDADGILAQRDGSLTQAFRVYNDYGAGVNFSRFALGFSGGVLNIGVEQGGTGANLGVAIKSLAGVSIHVGSPTTPVWNFVSAGHLLANLDNYFDIGASGANRPRNIYAAGIIEGASIIKTTAGGFIAISSRLAITSPADGVMNLADNAGTSFGRIQLGGALDTHPAIARDGAGIKFTGAAAGLTSWIKVPPVVIASLPSAVTAGVGARAFVTDALAPMFGSAVASGGTVAVPVYSNGTNWFVG